MAGHGLKKADIDTDIFKAHSVYCASTTAAVGTYVTPNDVMKTVADWSRVYTFQNFYHKPIFKSVMLTLSLNEPTCYAAVCALLFLIVPYSAPLLHIKCRTGR